MRLIRLNYNDFELFDISWTEVNLNFYSGHKDAFRQMWKEQVRQTFAKFAISVKLHCTNKMLANASA